jgi:hypothetical protein
MAIMEIAYVYFEELTIIVTKLNGTSLRSTKTIICSCIGEGLSKSIATHYLGHAQECLELTAQASSICSR